MMVSIGIKNASNKLGGSRMRIQSSGLPQVQQQGDNATTIKGVENPTTAKGVENPTTTKGVENPTTSKGIASVQDQFESEESKLDPLIKQTQIPPFMA
jgi:hypothetical protein